MITNLKGLLHTKSWLWLTFSSEAPRGEAVTVLTRHLCTTSSVTSKRVRQRLRRARNSPSSVDTNSMTTP